MKNFLTDILNVYTTYGSLKLISIFLLIVIPTAIFYYYKSKSKKILLLTVLSQLVAASLYLLLAYLGDTYFTSITNGYNQIGLFYVLILNNLNISKYSMDYTQEFKSKDPDPDIVNRAHFKTSLNSVITLVLLGSIGFFMPSELGQVIISTALTTVLVIGMNHLVIRKLFFDEK